LGHFGLALEEYAHFTSPIRRYPDLILHRAIKYLVAHQENNQLKAKWTETGGYNYQYDEVSQLGEHCSMTERRADDATRDVADALKCEYMQDHIGDTMVGTIAAVTNFGFFVRLNDIHIDGLVHVTGLISDYYQFDAGKQTLTGERTGRVYRIGDVLEVKVLSVNLDDKKIDFELADEALAGQRTRGRKPASRKTSDRPIDKRARSKAAPASGKKTPPLSEREKLQEGAIETQPAAAKKTTPKKKRPVKQGVKNTLSSKKKKTTSTKKSRPGRAERARNKAKKSD
ncbi:MAG: RNB domain-containing ribonuclease, partial [Psychromonas sp.]